MASASSSRTTRSPTPPRGYHDEVDSDNVQEEAAGTRNDSPSAAIPIPRNSADDLESGDDLAATLVNDQPSIFSPNRGWRAFASRGLSAVSRDSSQQQSPVDRNR